jgi:hypothetical protein
MKIKESRWWQNSNTMKKIKWSRYIYLIDFKVFDLFVVILGSVRFQYRMLISCVSLKATLLEWRNIQNFFFFK